jgi:thioredoxin:protein disulfide reductase
VGALMTYGLFLPPMGTAAGTGGAVPADAGQASAAAGVDWSDDLEAALMLAQIENKPVLVDFTADWCVACKELDHYTFSDPDVIGAFEDFILVRIDMTNAASPENKEYQQRYRIYGLPSVTFLTPSGQMLPHLTVTGFVRAPRFLEILQQALQEAKSAPEL